MKRYRVLRTALPIAAALFLCAQMSAELTVRRCRLAAESEASTWGPPRTVLSLFIGKLEELVGDVLLLKADNYFHGQTSLLGHTRVGECDHGLGHHAHGHHECTCGHDTHGPHAHHEPHHHAEAALGYEHFLYRQFLKVAPTAHVHIQRHEEIVPWLYASVRLNARNERAAVVAAYWLNRQLDRPRDAERVLRAALAERPSSWRLRGELAWLHYGEGRFGVALRQCKSAITLFRPEADEEASRLDLARLWRLASACQEELGHLAQAVACAEIVAGILQENEAAQERLDELKARLEAEPPGSGEPSDQPAEHP
jgi:tetratricopeptide (TPR) repeat protein